MAEIIGSSCSRVVVGLGKTGMSCVRYLAGKKLPFKVIDTRTNPPGLDELKNEYPDVPVHTGSFEKSWLLAADEIVLSPGIAVATPEIADAAATGVKVVGDIELFCREVNKPVVAITGSNGKSTVTSLLGEMAKAAGINVAVGGNIGVPVLDLLQNDTIELFVLELSSFQLETTHSLRATVATVLNLSPDHMDRYVSMIEYHQAKQRIYKGCSKAVYFKPDALTVPLLPQATPAIGFTSGLPDLNDYGLLTDSDGIWLCKGVTRLLNCAEMKLQGRHNQTNALAALALGESVNIPLEAMLSALKEFPGLSHRCQWVAEKDGVVWVNDSKATNVGASVAAIEGLGEVISGKVVLIAGGDGKGADFSQLRSPVQRYVRELIVIGRDGEQIAKTVEGAADCSHAEGLAEAIDRALAVSQQGDTVLLAPACASFDMFSSFEQRGDQFVVLVKEKL
ncbi:UDP-N-acetylmuramoyl-L-alanine--D-glutamate ligase [Endozoicomonas sp. OPT23]|uniref:UDP-N-acetylmuramoyl-L-alanine--D-glutamate ligase n=1 Tax=Endozoicomonas sp. OPT23 TaxID=2072845 RepID=UPI00351BBEA8